MSAKARPGPDPLVKFVEEEKNRLIDNNNINLNQQRRLLS